jgi:uncharacterized membrane protein YfcA
MVLSFTSSIILCILFFVVAVLYASVGFGGGSSYLAILALVAVSFFTMRSVALVCNIIVVIGSTYWFIKKGHFKIVDFLPFIISSVPMAFLGASFKLNEQLFFVLLGIVLMIPAIFLIWQTKTFSRLEGENTTQYSPFINYILGASIGFVSGMVGIGGGIFLAPILYYLKWGTPVKIAALASFFILVNSISGLGGLFFSETFNAPVPILVGLGLSVLIGGQVGVRLSFKKLSPSAMKVITAVLVFIVGVRVLLVNGLNVF